MSESEFRIRMFGEWLLEVEEIWPDGDAPKNPTAEDVERVMRPYGTHGLVREWNLVPVVEVNGDVVQADVESSGAKWR